MKSQNIVKVRKNLELKVCKNLELYFKYINMEVLLATPSVHP